MALYAFLTPDLSAVQVYPLTRTMVMKKAVVSNLVTMISSATDITSISPRIVEVQPSPRPPESAAYRIEEVDPVKNGGGVWVQTWQTVALSPADQTEKLNALKKGKWSIVAAKGKALRSGKFVAGPGEFDLSGDGFSRIVMMGVTPGPRTVPIGPNAQGIERYFDATAPQVAALVTAISNFIDATYARESELRDLVAAATSIAELNAIDIEAGWPSNS